MRYIAKSIEDCFVWTDHATGTAVDTEGRFDKVRLLWVATDRLGWAAFFAGTTTRTILCHYGKRHSGFLPTSASLLRSHLRALLQSTDRSCALHGTRAR